MNIQADDATINSSTGISRRTFFKASIVAGGGLALAAYVGPKALSFVKNIRNSLALDAFVEIGIDGQVILFAHTPEMGQGVKTSLPMIIAEELGVNWDDVTVLTSAVDEERFGQQRAGGSRSTPNNWNLMREAGAAAREMLVGAAAKQTGHDRDEFYTENSFVIHKPSDTRIPFKDLAAKAAMEKVPSARGLTFKDKKDYKIIGTAVTGVDNKALVTGESLFGVDVQLPGMLYAVYEKCPAFFGKVKSANLDEIKALPGIVDAFVLEGNDNELQLLDGVAIVAKSTWQAMSALQKLKVEWDEKTASKDDWYKISQEAKTIAQTNGQREISHVGNVNEQYADSDNKVLESFYTHPFVAHACMEPMNCTASYDAEKNTMEVWVPSQVPSRIYGVVEGLLGVPRANITIHQTRMGGAFGRRGRTDFSTEATQIAKRMNAPVKLTWTREQDMTHDLYRAGGFHSMKGAVDKEGKLAAFETHLIGTGLKGEPTSGTRLSAAEFPGLCAKNYRASMSLIDTLTPCGPWRAPGSNVTGFAVQSFIAELAHAANRDHLEFLLEIMGEPRWFEEGNIRSLNTGRAADVIKLAAEKAGWGKALPKGHGLGLAFHFSHAGHVAEVAEVSVEQLDNGKKKLHVHNITAAVDIGPVINMSGAKAQVEGSIIDGLSTMLDLQITMQNGRIQENNFHQYNLMRIRHTPKVDMHFIQSDNMPTGIGEPALPPLAPAIGNAIFAATGERIRSMPLSKEGFVV